MYGTGMSHSGYLAAWELQGSKGALPVH